MGIWGFILGTMISQFAGAWVYHRAKSKLGWVEVWAAILSGIAATTVASLAYAFARTNVWLAGPGSSIGVCVFMGVCTALVQAVLFRGRPSLRPRA